MRLIFMGTPAFAVPALRALHAAGHEIAAVYTQPPRPAGRGQNDRSSPVQQEAERLSLPVFCPVSLKSPEVQAAFAVHGADAAVVAAYGLLLPQAILNAPKFGCINIHPSLLPRWRGAAPIQRTLMAGDARTGVCIMRMEAGLDTGDVFACEEFDIPPEMDAGALHDALAERGAALLLNVLQSLESATARATPQSGAGVTYAQKISKEEARIDWRRPAREIACLIRSLSPAPGAFFMYNNEIIKVFAATPEPAGSAAPPGKVLDDALSIACGEGTALRLREVQRAGKKRMPASEMLKGLMIPADAQLDIPRDAAL